MLIPNPDLDFWNFNPKISFWANLGPKSLEFQKTNLRKKISIFKILNLRKLISTSSRYCACVCVCASFQAKQTALTFSAQICPKVDLGLTVQKIIVGIRISILDIPCVPSFSQNEQLWIFGPNMSKKGFRVRNWEK